MACLCRNKKNVDFEKSESADKRRPIQLSLDKETGKFNSGHCEMDWFQSRISERQYEKFINDLNESVTPIHKQISAELKLLKQQKSKAAIGDVCVLIQHLFAQLEEEIDQHIYSNEYVFLTKNLKIINNIQHSKLEDILNDPDILTADIHDITTGTLFQLYKDGVIIKEVNKAKQQLPKSEIDEGRISFNV